MLLTTHNDSKITTNNFKYTLLFIEQIPNGPIKVYRYTTVTEHDDNVII